MNEDFDSHVVTSIAVVIIVFLALMFLEGCDRRAKQLISFKLCIEASKDAAKCKESK